MNRDEALRTLAAAGNLNADELIAYANEDQLGGRDTGQWNAMSTFAAEGQIIYALIRALKPQRVLEIGVASGGTSTHILTALDRNDKGALYSIDLEPNCGINIPETLRHRWTFTAADALTAYLPPVDFVFEDGAHTLDFTITILNRLKELDPRVICSHDFFTHETYGGFAVKEAWDQVIDGGVGIKVDGAFTGLGVWFNPNKETPEPSQAEVAPVAKPKSATKKAGKRG